MIYTSAPVVMLGSLEQDVSPRTSVRYPRLYEPGIARLWFSRQEFAQFAIHGLITSLILIGVIMGNSCSTLCMSSSCVLCPNFILFLACCFHFLLFFPLFVHSSYLCYVGKTLMFLY